MSILVVKASKPLADSKLGFTYSLTEGDSPTVTSVKKDGLFGGSDLRKGHEVLLINGSSTRIGIQDMRDLLKSLPKGTVTLIVRAPPSGGAPAEAGEAAFKLGRKSSVTKNKMLATLHRSVMKQEIDAVPRLLQGRGVPEQEWYEIYTMVGRDLLAATDDYVTKKDKADKIRDHPPHAETHHQHTQSHVGALYKSIIAQQKCMMTVSDVKARANAILAKYNIEASDVYEKLGDDKVTTGLKFCACGDAPPKSPPAETASAVADPAVGAPSPAVTARSADIPAADTTAADAPAASVASADVPAADAPAADTSALDKEAAGEDSADGISASFKNLLNTSDTASATADAATDAPTEDVDAEHHDEA